MQRLASKALKMQKGEKGRVWGRGFHLKPPYPRNLCCLRPELRLGKDYGKNFVGSHDAVAIAVQNMSQIGGLSLPIYNSMVARGTIDLKSYRPRRVRSVPAVPLDARSDLDTSLKEAITKAFIDLKDEKGIGILQSRWVRSNR